ncbi:MAG: hypothetical protein AAGU19_22810 [Prolixibacteraceae bacterium]
MKRIYRPAISLLTLLFLFYGCEKENQPDVPEDGYARLKQAAKNSTSVFYQDFDESEEISQIAADQWQIGSVVWWIPPWNSTTIPVIEDSCMVLSSTKQPGSDGTKNEAQTIADFPVTRNGEFIVGYKSTRWKHGYNTGDYWADSNVGLEFYYNPPHQAIVFTYGSMGVFSDPTGFCPDNSCVYAPATDWPAISESGDFLGIRITWETGADNTRTFKLYFNDAATASAELSDVNYDLRNLRIRLNANVTDADKLPALDSDTLYVDYIVIKDHVMELE